jgi:cytochrome c peroxidase
VYSLLLLVLPMSYGHSQIAVQTPQQGPGDVRDGYENSDFRTRSVSLQARRGQEADLLANLETPPLGLPVVPVPDDNPLTRDKVQLGRKLFFDRRLSANNTISCAMCHIAEQGFAQNELKTPVGIEGKSVRRNAPTIYNVAYLKRVFHDGREFSLENQVWGPLLASNEMGNLSVGIVIERIRSFDDYDELFAQAFNRGPDMQTIGMALASYERTLVSGDSNFDRWHFAADKKALGVSAQRGLALFLGKARCAACHSVEQEFALLTDNDFHNTGVGYFASMRPADAELVVLLAPGQTERVDTDILQSTGTERPRDLGRYEVTGSPNDRWRYRTPTLRNVVLTAPYMHDGSLPTLRDVLLFYNRGGVPNETLDPLIRPLGLSDGEIDDLLNFLRSLTGANVDVLVSDAFAAPIGGS